MLTSSTFSSFLLGPPLSIGVRANSCSPHAQLQCRCCDAKNVQFSNRDHAYPRRFSAVDPVLAPQFVDLPMAIAKLRGQVADLLSLTDEVQDALALPRRVSLEWTDCSPRLCCRANPLGEAEGGGNAKRCGPERLHSMSSSIGSAGCQRPRYPAAQRSSNPPLGPEDPVYSIAPPCARRGRSMS
jgi:hypothetical protein